MSGENAKPGTLAGYLQHEDGLIEVRLVKSIALAEDAALAYRSGYKPGGWWRSSDQPLSRHKTRVFRRDFRPYYFLTADQLGDMQTWPEWRPIEPYIGLGFWPGKPAPAEPETPDPRKRLLVHASGTGPDLRLHLHLEPDKKYTGLLPGKKGQKQAKRAVEIIGTHGEACYEPVAAAFERLRYALEAGWPVGPVLDEIRRTHHQVECKRAQKSWE